MPTVYKKLEQDDEIKILRNLNILTWTGYSTERKIIVSIKNNEDNRRHQLIEYKFTNRYQYKQFRDKLKKIVN